MIIAPIDGAVAKQKQSGRKTMDVVLREKKLYCAYQKHTNCTSEHELSMLSKKHNEMKI